MGNSDGAGEQHAQAGAEKVTVESKGNDHCYILLDGKWAASCVPSLAEVVREAVAAYVNRTVPESET